MHLVLLQKNTNTPIDVDCILYNAVVDGLGLYFYHDVSGKNRSVSETPEVRSGRG